MQPVHSHYQKTQLRQYSHVLRKVAERRLAFDVRRFGRGDYHRYLHQAPHKWRNVPHGFARIAAAARAMDAKVVLAIFPHSVVPHWKAYPYGDLHAQSGRAGREAGFEVLDMLPTMQGLTPPAVRLSPSDDHPNAKGHQMAGEELAQYLRGARWLDGP